MNLVEKVQPSYQTGLVSNEYLLLNRPVWYEVGAYFLPDWSGKKAVLFFYQIHTFDRQTNLYRSFPRPNLSINAKKF